MKLILFLNLKDDLTMPIFHQQMFSVNNITMTSVYSIKSDTPSDNLNHQDSHACEKLGQDDTFLIDA